MLVDTLIYILIFAAVYFPMGVIVTMLLKDGRDISILESILTVIFWPVCAMTFLVAFLVSFIAGVISRWRE